MSTDEAKKYIINISEKQRIGTRLNNLDYMIGVLLDKDIGDARSPLFYVITAA